MQDRSRVFKSTTVFWNYVPAWSRHCASLPGRISEVNRKVVIAIALEERWSCAASLDGSSKDVRVAVA